MSVSFVQSYFNKAEAAAGGPSVTVEVHEPSDLPSDPPSSPLYIDYTITSELGPSVSATGVNVTQDAETFSFNTTSVNSLPDGRLTISLTVYDRAGNPPQTNVVADMILGECGSVRSLWWGRCSLCFFAGGVQILVLRLPVRCSMRTS